MNKQKSFAAKGFTIIELIVVIAIIAVLAAIVMVNVVQYVNKAKDATVISDIQGLNVASTSYFAMNGGSYDHFCDTDPSALSVGKAIANIGSGYHFYCNDSSGIYMDAYNNKPGWIPYAYATPASVCAGQQNNFVAWVQTPSGACACSDTNGLDTSNPFGTGSSSASLKSSYCNITLCGCP